MSGVPSGKVSLHTEKGPVYGLSLPDTGSRSVEWHIAAFAFVRVEVRDLTGDMAALSNPIVISPTRSQ